MRKWLKKWGVGLILLLFAAVSVWLARAGQGSCTLCDSQAHHGLCLVDLHTGRVYELTVYDPNPYVPGTLQDLQSTGTMSALDLDDLHGWRYCGDSAYVSIPAENRHLRRDLFCGDCRKLVEKHRQVGYVIADLLDPEKPKIFPILLPGWTKPWLWRRMQQKF